MDKSETLNLSGALSLFEDHLDDIKQGCEDNIRYIISTTKRPDTTNDEMLDWVRTEVWKLRLKTLIDPLQHVHKRIVSRQQHVLNPKRSAITDEMIQRAREYPIEELYDGRLFGKDKKKFGLCPFHNERTPSFNIFPDNHYHCFGCGEHGSSIDFVMKTQNKTFIEAIRQLQ